MRYTYRQYNKLIVYETENQYGAQMQSRLNIAIDVSCSILRKEQTNLQSEWHLVNYCIEKILTEEGINPIKVE